MGASTRTAKVAIKNIPQPKLTNEVTTTTTYNYKTYIENHSWLCSWQWTSGFIGKSLLYLSHWGEWLKWLPIRAKNTADIKVKIKITPTILIQISESHQHSMVETDSAADCH